MSPLTPHTHTLYGQVLWCTTAVCFGEACSTPLIPPVPRIDTYHQMAKCFSIPTFIRQSSIISRSHTHGTALIMFLSGG